MLLLCLRAEPASAVSAAGVPRASAPHRSRSAEEETARSYEGTRPPSGPRPLGPSRGLCPRGSARGRRCGGSRRDAGLAAEERERALDPSWRTEAVTLRSVSLTTLWRKHRFSSRCSQLTFKQISGAGIAGFPRLRGVGSVGAVPGVRRLGWEAVCWRCAGGAACTGSPSAARPFGAISLLHCDVNGDRTMLSSPCGPGFSTHRPRGIDGSRSCNVLYECLFKSNF